MPQDDLSLQTKLG